MTFQTLVVKLSWATIPLFWPLFVATLVAAAWFSLRSHDRFRSGLPLRFERASAWFVGCALVPYVTFMTWGGDFTYHDNDVFTEHTVVGKPWPLAIWPVEGRYFPVFAQEFRTALASFSSTWFMPNVMSSSVWRC
jgi:hypothetical protein